MGELSLLPNIGKELDSQLQQIGIYNLAQLKNKGAKEAWLEIQKVDSSACANRLYSLQGAIMGIKKKDLPEDTKIDLKSFYTSHKL